MSIAAIANRKLDEQLLEAELLALGSKARAAARTLALAPAVQKNAALLAAAKALRGHAAHILAQNQKDVAAARDQGRPDSFVDRLKLTDARIESMARGLEEIAELPDPVGRVSACWKRPNGLEISRVQVPLGVIGIIYESRPNVTSDAGGLCLKSGNAVILRGGSECVESNRAIHACLKEGLLAAELPDTAIQLIGTPDRSVVGHLLEGLQGSIDVIVPRGGKSLVERVQKDARVPVFAHLEGICHVYVDASADLEKARTVVLNAKLRRTGICGAAETLLVDEAGAGRLLQPLVRALLNAGCEVRGDPASQATDARVIPASESDWGTEYLDAIISVKVVSGVRGAIDHIEKYGSHHTESIIAEDTAAAETFLREVDSAIVLHNASTQFADGGEFGMGAEIGIATGRFHARGPIGVEQLTTFKYVVRGDGQIRPA
ncbi:MAG TPA: glutamate-5-semialdehyde dehydrogenase [Hyphomicrobiales bacterium]|nr:glutamate-5-semialdehyde dehydrogenase [Hyphomicrobiales bacterium]